MELKVARRKYHAQKNQARLRGIGWELTFRQWLEWWGEDLDKRGSRRWNLQMQRVGDKGPYALGNIRKGTPRQNSHTYSLACDNRRALQAHEDLQVALDNAEVDLHPHQDRGDPEAESISDYFARRGELRSYRF